MSPDEKDERSQGNPFVTVAASVLDVLDPLLFAAGLATHIAFIIDRSDYGVVLWLSVALLCASSFTFFVGAFVYPSTFLHPRLEAVLLRLYGFPRMVLLLVLSPLLPVLTWLHWKLIGRTLDASDPSAAPVGDAVDSLLPLLRDFDATDDRADGVRCIVHSVVMLTCAPRRLLLLDAAHTLPRCLLQFTAITFTSGSPTQYVAVVVSMVTVLSKAYAICGRSTHVSTFVFKVALVTYDLFALFYILSVRRYFTDRSTELVLSCMLVGTLGMPSMFFPIEPLVPLWSLFFSDVTGKLFFPWGGTPTCSPGTFLQLLVGYPLWLVTYVSNLPTVLMLLLGAKLSFRFIYKPMLNAEAVEARRLLVNFVTQPDRGSDPELEERVMHLYRWFHTNMTQYTHTPELLESLASEQVSAGRACCSDCVGDVPLVGGFVAPMVLFGIAHPFASFATHEGPHSVMSLTLFSCMLAALAVAAVLVPRMLTVARVNGMMEPAFRQEVCERRSHKGKSWTVAVNRPVTWTLSQARQCIKEYFAVSMAVELPLVIEQHVLPAEVIRSCIAPYLDTAVTTSRNQGDVWRMISAGEPV